MRITQQNEVQEFYGHGKLLITAEYFVLDGARALALPTKFGQTLRVKELHAVDSTLYWVALNSKKQSWLNLVFETDDFSCLNSKAPEADRLSKMLQEARKLNPVFLTDKKDRAVETQLQFPNEWGLGTSSTLIHCISKWAGVDGYALLKNTIGGSGYDVACAAHDSAILYQLQNGAPETLPVNWKPSFSDKIYFAYTGQKQLSSEAIKYYREKLQDKTHAINELNRLTQLTLECSDFAEFEQLVYEHENLIASQLKLMKVSDTLLSDYWGAIKSLGAWGGDFVMMANGKSWEELTAFLQSKNIDTVFSWEEIILE